MMCVCVTSLRQEMQTGKGSEGSEAIGGREMKPEESDLI